MRRCPHILVVLLATAGLLLQLIGAGLPLGSIVCIGCDAGTGWAIGSPCEPESPGCCDHDNDAPSSDEHDSRGASPCDCVDVPVGGPAWGFSISSASGRSAASLAGTDVPGTWPAVALPILLPAVVDMQAPGFGARAGPCGRVELPPRQLIPLARRTILTE